ncbi:MAG: hypothetical protein CVU43_04605 [Chloroflexi bacterium HGW-Chloroflexi-5]|jgi:hypothetical protein|nr:MAG: hypothetical protein CVU43_04605 [Chloroflexi bacterium HGW-Chloroflexi-5]
MEEQKFINRECVVWRGHEGWVIGHNRKFPELVQIAFPFGFRQFRESDPELSKKEEKNKNKDR